MQKFILNFFYCQQSYYVTYKIPIYSQGIELRSTDLEPVLATLSRPHAEAIKQRVRALNHTVRGRSKNRSKRKPDIRDVFRDFDVNIELIN